MNPTEVIFAARDQSIALRVDPDRREIVYQPACRMTPELLAEIKVNKDHTPRVR